MFFNSRFDFLSRIDVKGKFRSLTNSQNISKQFFDISQKLKISKFHLFHFFFLLWATLPSIDQKVSSDEIFVFILEFFFFGVGFHVHSFVRSFFIFTDWIIFHFLADSISHLSPSSGNLKTKRISKLCYIFKKRKDEREKRKKNVCYVAALRMCTLYVCPSCAAAAAAVYNLAR